MARKYVGMAKVPGEDVIENIIRVVQNHPIELEEKISTLDKPLIIECACPGWQPKFWPPPRAYPAKKPLGHEEGGVRFPAIPCQVDELVELMVEAVKLGASALHLHPRDPEDCVSINRTDLTKEIYDKIFAQVDAVSLQHTWERTEDNEINYLGKHGTELLRLGNGNKYCQGAVVLWPPGHSYPPDYTQSVQEGVRFLEENKIKPIHKFRNYYSVRQMKRVLIDTKIITEEPYILVHDMGHPRGWPMDMDPWGPIDLNISIMQTKQRLGDHHIIGVYSGGRNWMPITISAILAGADLVRVGIEDCYWMYPHKDEVIQTNTEAIKKIVDFCHIIGRELATPQQAREILGITLTSK